MILFNFTLAMINRPDPAPSKIFIWLHLGVLGGLVFWIWLGFKLLTR
jgi:hypothetical protein